MATQQRDEKKGAWTHAGTQPNKTETKQKRNTHTQTDLDDLRRWLGLLERLAGVIHDVDLHARALVAERGVEPCSRARRDIVARRGLQVDAVHSTETEKPGLNLPCRRRSHNF